MSNVCDYTKLYNFLKDNLNTFQISLHQPEDKDHEDGEYYIGNEINTIFFRDYKRSSWYFQYPEIVPFSATGDDTGTETQVFVYKVKTQAHTFTASDICQKLPSIRCKPGYKAKWGHNIGSNIFEEGVLTFNDQQLQFLDQIYIDHYNQTMTTKDEKYAIKQNLGNIDILQTFSDVLPAYETSFKPPWFYQYTSNVFPLYYCSMLDKFEHRITLRRNIANLLIVVDETTGDIVEANSASISKIGEAEVTNDTLTLPVPTMWGTYIYLSDAECEANRYICEEETSLHDKKNIFHIEDIIKLQYENLIYANNTNTITIKIPHTEFPVTNFAWMAQNQKSVSIHEYSNYSTNYQNCMQGWSPIFNSTLSYGKSLIFKDMASFRTERVYPSTQRKSIPEEPGYNNWSLGLILEEYPVPGVVVKDGYLSVKFMDTNPFIRLGVGSKCNDAFRCFLYMTYSKRLTFEYFAVDERSRHASTTSTNGTQIKIEGDF